jgi:hypothetical protein
VADLASQNWILPLPDDHLPDFPDLSVLNDSDDRLRDPAAIPGGILLLSALSSCVANCPGALSERLQINDVIDAEEIAAPWDVLRSDTPSVEDLLPSWRGCGLNEVLAWRRDLSLDSRQLIC